MHGVLCWLRNHQERERLDKRRIFKFIKYFLMLFISLNVITLMIVILLNPGLLVSISIVLAISVVGVIIAARDAGYVHWF